MRAAARRDIRAVVVSAVLLLALALTGSPAAAATKTKIYLVRDDRLQTVKRTVPDGVDPVLGTVQALFRGPTPLERRDGIRSAIPRGSVVNEVVVANGIAFVRVPETFAAGGSGEAVELRLTQIVYTVTSVADVGAVRILLGDEPVPAPGEDPGAVISLATLPRREIIGPVPVGIAQVQRRLAQLRYLPARGAITARLDYRTSQALLAFQAWEGLARTGEPNLDTRRRLNVAKIPVPRVRSQKRRMEVSRWKGVLLLIEGGRVKRAIHISTGAGGRTPRGMHSIYRKERVSYSRPFKVWLPFASYFSGGFAFHEYPNVPAYPASHGCIRIGYPEARGVYEFAAYGTVVSIV